MVRSLVPKSNGGELAPQGYSPFGSLQREMNRLLDRFFGDTEMSRFSAGEGLALMPQVDVSETDDAIEVTADLPGMEDKDVDVSLMHDVLTIRGEKKHETEQKEKNYHRVERSYGSFHRSIPLPAEVDSEHVDATFSKGVLKIRMPKIQKGNGSKKIEVRRAE